jgi:nucleotide-binding universal stress UspA family protein
VQEERHVGWAADQSIKLYRISRARIHLLNVQRPLPRHVSRFFSSAYLRDFHLESGMLVLAPVMHQLEAAGVPYKTHVLTGHEAETIVRFAEEYGCTRIVMESQPDGLLSVLGLGAISSQVRHLMRTRNMQASLDAANVL